MSKIKQQLKKGILEIAILSLLQKEDYYGYEMITTLKEKSNNVFTLVEGTLYPILYRLEDGKLIESYWKTESDSRSKPRKYYRITTKGTNEYEDAKNSFNEIVDGLHLIMKSHK